MNIKHLFITVIFIFSALFQTHIFAAAANANTQSAEQSAAKPDAALEITHKSGKTRIPLQPKKIIVFDLASLDILNRLGVRGIIGVPDQQPLPAYLDKYADARYPKTGTLFEPDYEAVAAARPDLVIIAGRSQPKYRELAKIAPTIDLTVGTEQYLADIQHNTRLLGQIFGKEQQAEQEIAALDKAIATLQKRSASKGSGLVILTTGGKISAFGTRSRFGLIYDTFGVKPADAKLIAGNHGQPVSSEYLLSVNPDWLFVIDRDAAIGANGQSARQILNNAIAQKTNAAQKGQIVYLDAQNCYLVGGSLSGVHETAEQINQAYDDSEQKRKQ